MTYPVHHPDTGVSRQVLSDDPGLMLVRFGFVTGAEGRVHSHPHVQATYVAFGRFEFTIGEKTHDIGPGDTLMIPSGVPHGCRCIEAGVLIDSFAPRRDDFL